VISFRATHLFFFFYPLVTHFFVFDSLFTMPRPMLMAHALFLTFVVADVAVFFVQMIVEPSSDEMNVS
jgi:hypothetical protein